MIHRFIHDILTNGVEVLQADPSILDELFIGNYELVSNEADTIKEYFIAHGFNVYNGYPRKDEKFPAISIVLAEEGEVEHLVGDSAGLITDPTDPEYRAEILASIWGHKYRMLIMTEHPDVTSYYYEIAKFIMLEGLDVLVDDGCWEFQFDGSELAPDPRYMPEFLFARQLIFSCQREFQRIDSASKQFRSASVGGIHVDSSGSPSDVGGVNTRVTTYDPNEE